MQKLLVIAALLLLAAAALVMANHPPMQKDYDKLWQQTDSLSKIRQPRAAIDVLDNIAQLAKRDGNSQQLIKAYLFRLKLSQEFEEDYLEKAITHFDKELSAAKAPEKHILHSILGELYYNFFSANRYILLERSATVNYEGIDIKTWDASKIIGLAGHHYMKSLENDEEIKKISIRSFDAILETEENSTDYRPTLFDFLAWRAIGFFSNDESDIKVASRRFIPTDGKFFDPAIGFVNLEIPVEFENSNTARVLTILQRILAFHLNDKNPTALIDADLKRLEFVHGKTVLADKDEKYLLALNTLAEAYNFSEASAMVSFQIAQFHNNRASQYNPLDGEEMRWENKKAIDICHQAIANFPQSIGAGNCKILIDNILLPEITLQLDKTVLPGIAGLGLLQWKNYDKAYFRIIPMKYEDFRDMNQNETRENIMLKLSAMAYSQQWIEQLPDDKDYQRHSAEIKIPPQQHGYYVLIASGSQDFGISDGQVAYAGYWSTALSYLSQRLTAGGYDFFILNSENGAAAPGATMKMYKREYDNRKRNFENVFTGELQSDKSGFIRVNPDNSLRGGITVEISKGNDRYIPDENFFLSTSRVREEKPESKTFFFTDRAIYRPGQLLYFKGIMLEKTGDKHEIAPGIKTKVEFYDVNNRLISAQELTGNDFGSVSGFFTIPTGLINGMMQLKNENGSVWIRVEEYKRPQFEVNYEPLRDAYKLGEEITVQGKARAYSGINIDGAAVKYRVIRNTWFPFPIYSLRGIWPSSPPIEIAAGETVTDADGMFSVKFTAIPDYSGTRRFKPSFNYTIYADVTDINGETQSGNTAVNVGEQALMLDVSAPENINLLKNSDLKILATNLNGVSQPTEVNVKITRLQQSGEMIVPRRWQQPDIFLYDEAAFRKDFLLREYQNESDPSSWDKAEIIFEQLLITSKDSIINKSVFDKKPQGKYLIELNATDIFGNEVNTSKIVTLFDPSAKRPPVATFEWFETLNARCEPGQSAQFLLASSARNVNVLTEVQFRGETIRREWIKLNNSQQIISIPVREEHRGNLTFQYSYVLNNSVYSGSAIIEVPYNNKMLDIAFETMRTQLEPGSNEKWTITIRDKQGSKVAAEMLASMYDASLDAFVPHNWHLNLYSIYNNMNNWRASDNFNVVQASVFSLKTPMQAYYKFPEYDRLNWFGYSAFGAYFGRERVITAKGRQIMEPAAMMNEMAIADDSAGQAPEAGQIDERPSSTGIPQPAGTGFQVRRDFRETAFFFPQMKTNENGDVVIEFTLPESFTRWKFMGLGYTKNLMTGMIEKEFTASKNLMVTSNAPRFLREGDTIYFSAKITNISDEMLDGTATVEFFDPVSMNNVSAEFLAERNSKLFNVDRDRSTSVNWKIIVPKNRSMVTWRIKATTRSFTDGEEKTLPILPNRMMVTEAMPMMVSANQTRQFTFENLIQSFESETQQNYRLTLEFSSNPVWFAVQALPVISEVNEKNAVSVFNAFFANSIAFHITNSNPQIKRVFERWKLETPETFLSNLEKNQELKQALLEQTPWVLDATNEKEQKERIALLFDLNNMRNRLDATIRQLEQLQLQNGGFSWMNQMRESRYITQMIVQGFGKLDHLGILDAIGDDRIRRMMNSAVRYLDSMVFEDFERIQKNHPEKINHNHLSATQIQYLYARSFFRHIKINPMHETGYNYFANQAQQYWQDQNMYLQGMIALALHRNKVTETSALIVKSLKDRSLQSDEIGMYWRSEGGFYWYQAPIETQALMIEVFDEVASDNKSVEQMKIWLLTQKQTTSWKTGRATAEAVYALMGRGRKLLENSKPVEISVAGKTLNSTDKGTIEAGSGYFKMVWLHSDIKPEQGNITITQPNNGIAWGAMYRQYFEDLDKIKGNETGLSVRKQLFVERNTEKGQSISPLENDETINVGDRLMVRIEIRVDRDMEFVHLRDMRAAGFEPELTISGYQFKGGLGYYQSIKDVSADFFFDHLPKGTYVFEYPLRASQAGDFSNGIATLQCMYAPEFVSHSKGLRVKVLE